MSFKGDYLRVRTPITTDGQILKLDSNGQVQYREDQFDIAARKMLEAKNAKLPESLRRQIEVVSASQPIKPKRAVPAPPVDEEEFADIPEQPVKKTTKKSGK